MDFSLEKHIFCHDLSNPPNEIKSSYIELQLIKSVGSIEVRRVRTDSAESMYLVIIPSGHDLGFTTGEQGDLENEFENLVLAFNLTQMRICMTSKRGDFPSSKVTPKPPESKISVSKLDRGYHIQSEDTIVVRDEIHVGVHLSGTIEEQKIMEIFRKIQKLRRFDRMDSSNLQNLNFNNALRHYESGISDYDSFFKFKHFFNSLELVINMAGEDKTGDSFDNEVAKVSSASKEESMDWREFYNRIKHVQRNSNEINKYYEGIDSLTKKLQPIRTCLNYILLSKLS